MNGKRAVKINEANWPVQKSIRLVKAAKADEAYEKALQDWEDEYLEIIDQERYFEEVGR